jgi:hypothetical protein
MPFLFPPYRSVPIVVILNCRIVPVQNVDFTARDRLLKVPRNNRGD